MLLHSLPPPTCRKNEWALDRTVLVTEVTKKTLDQVSGAAVPSQPGISAREPCIRPDAHTQHPASRSPPWQVDAPSRDGAYVHGLVLEGCGWDDKAGACGAHQWLGGGQQGLPLSSFPHTLNSPLRVAGVLADSRPKELFTPMPVMLMKAVPAEKEPK